MSKAKSSSSNVTADKALTWKSICCQEGISAPRCARGAGGFGQCWGGHFFQGGPKASHSLSCRVTSRAMGSVQEQKSLFSTGIATTDALEAIAEKNEKGVFTPPESLPCGPGRLTGLPCNILIQLQYCPSGTRIKPQTHFQQTT